MAKIQTSLRIEQETFEESKKILKSLGLNFSEAVNIFAAMVVQERGLPFEVTASRYPPIEYEEAREKVRRSFKRVDEGRGIDAEEFFDTLTAQ
ncbi:type II toxin-antitoxin system RelB/DinJ family antitoxin [Nitratifractor sp.]